MLTFAFLSGAGAAVAANKTTILAVWVLFEQYLAANPKIKANSTLQLVVNLSDMAIRNYFKKN
jgi:hypothetical protein